MMKKLIDISEHNGNVNLSQARPFIDGVIARCSWGWGNSNQIDKQWKNNAVQANSLDIPLFAYHYSYARNVYEAKQEAELALLACKNHRVNVIYYDIEYSDYQGDLSPNEFYEIAKSFCDHIEKSGYSVGIYANENYFKTKLTNPGFSKWTLWLANYGNNNGYDNWNGRLQYNPFGNVLIHQCTSNAKEGIFKNIKGIPSAKLDGNIDHGLLATFNKAQSFNDISVGSKVKIKQDATWYDGQKIPSFAFNQIYDVIELIKDRAVIGIGKKVTGAINVKSLIIV